MIVILTFKESIMKLFLVLLSVAFSTSVFAAANTPEQTQELVKALIENSASIDVVNKDLNSHEKNLADKLTQALAASVYSDSKSQIVVTLDSSCKDVTPKGLVGVGTMDCTLNINNGDYTKTKLGLTGPETESSYILTFKTQKVVAPNAKLKIKDNKVSLQIAG